MEGDLLEANSRQWIGIEAKRMVIRFRDYFRSQDPLICETDLDKKVAGIAAIPASAVKRMRLQADKNELVSPPAKRKRRSYVLDGTDGFSRDCIRRELYGFYETGNLPTLDALLEKVSDPPINFKGSRSSLYNLLVKMGFKYRKIQSGRHILMEREDIVAARCKYLRITENNRNSSNPRHLIYLDETWVNQNECVNKCWTTSEGKIGPKLKTGRGERFIILHAGGEDGFVPGGLLLFRSKNGNKGDYHDSMNHLCFRQWFVEQLLPNIPDNCLIVMDNAPYHSKITNKAPNRNNNKTDIIQWLVANNVVHDRSETKYELLQLVAQNKYKEKYEIDEIARSRGHEVLRLPPYHCNLNPIELIWAQVKTEIKKKNSNSDQTLKRIENLTKTAINNVSPENWRKCIRHTKEIEDKYRKNDVAASHLLDSFIIHLSDSDDTSDDDT